MPPKFIVFFFFVFYPGGGGLFLSTKASYSERDTNNTNAFV
jgi:hypothetical protein